MKKIVFQRKIYSKLKEWKESSKGKTALLIEGARRVGKTFVATTFAKNEFPEYTLIDFSLLNDKFKAIFNDLSNIENFFRDLFLALDHKPLRKGSLIIFDEVQFCPKARQAIKALVNDARYYYIETGSLVSIKENTKDILLPSEEEAIQMYPLDYEEFLLAIDQSYELEVLKETFKNHQQIPHHLHQKFMKTYRSYLSIGGMPQAVLAYITSKDFFLVERLKSNILKLYEEDLKKIDQTYGTFCYSIYLQIPTMLTKHSFKFKNSSISSRVDSYTFKNSMNKLIESKIVIPVYRCLDPQGGFLLSKDDTHFKLYLLDVGLFTSLIYARGHNDQDNIYRKLILDDTHLNLGMLYETAITQSLVANNFIPYYHLWIDLNGNNTPHYYELDFLVQKGHKIIPIEVKSSRSFATKSLDLFEKKYSKNIFHRYCISPKPLKYENNLTYLPFYLSFCLK